MSPFRDLFMRAPPFRARETLRWRALLSDTRRLLWTVDETGKVKESSFSWETFTGQSPEQMMEHQWMESVHPDDRERLRPGGSALATASIMGEGLQCRVRRADGAWRNVRVRRLPVKDDAGRLLEWLFLGEDITGRASDRQEQARTVTEEECNTRMAELESRERLLAATLEQMPSGVLLVGPGGEPMLANAQAKAISDRPLPHPEKDRNIAAYYYHRLDGTECPLEELPLWRSLHRGQVVNGEVLWLYEKDSKDNRFCKVNSAPVYDEHGQTLAAVAVFENITEAYRTEERAKRLQSITSALSQAHTPRDVARAFITETLGFMDINAGAVYRQRADGMFEVLHDVGYPESYIGKYRLVAPNADTPVTNAVRTGKKIWFRSSTTLSEHFPEVMAARLEWSNHAAVVLPMWVNDKPIGAIALSFTQPRASSPEEMQFLLMLAQQCGQALERARLFEEADTKRQRAEQASRLKDDFLGVLCHELRTPLTTILGWTQILRARELAPDKREYALETIESSTRTQTQLIEKLLDVNLIMSGRLQLDVHPTDLTRVIENALDGVRPTAETKGIHLQSQLDSQTVPLKGDPERLQQVVRNLLCHAVKRTPQGGSVTVSLSRTPSHVEFQVSDTGEGLAADRLPHLFERVRLADASSTRRYEGLGLELPIVRNLVELHGGTVEARSAGKGQGTTFIVRLPCSGQ